MGETVAPVFRVAHARASRLLASIFPEYVFGPVRLCLHRINGTCIYRRRTKVYHMFIIMSTCRPNHWSVKPQFHLAVAWAARP